MPQYDYHCQQCNHDFTVQLGIAEHEQKEKDRQIHCPRCDSPDVKHVFQSVFVTTSKKS